MYDYYEFAPNTFVVFNRETNQEFCICGKFESENVSAEQRAKTIVELLNEKSGLGIISQRLLKDEVCRFE